ncbi:uncharacterized protein J3D65DRAFT_312661 [Phyllosticta citribraziliensis]|uniref:AD domain-containing protein n=1 Tax=Phyllosticta citribraziliensis TaxID=989973 RepID=A0ABR1LS96_9PEZI
MVLPLGVVNPPDVVPYRMHQRAALATASTDEAVQDLIWLAGFGAIHNAAPRKRTSRLTTRNSLPVRWHEQSIVIDDAVILGPPYTLNNLKAGEGKEMTLAHIRKIMESHLAKKKASGQQPQRPGIATVTPIPPWKGG